MCIRDSDGHTVQFPIWIFLLQRFELLVDVAEGHHRIERWLQRMQTGQRLFAALADLDIFLIT